MRIICCLCILSVLIGCSGTSVDNFSFGDLFSDVAASPVKIKNETGVDIVLFKETVSQNTAIGGVPAGQMFGIKSVEGYYLLKAVTKSDVEANQGDLLQCKIVGTVLLYVDSTWTTNTFKQADPGPGLVMLQNNSQKYVDVKVDSFYGDTVAILAPGESRKLFLPYEDYDIFPSYLTIVTKNNIVTGITRKFKVEAAGSVSLYSGAPVKTIIIPDSPDAVKDIYLYVKNKSPKGARFASGADAAATIYHSTIDRQVVNPDGGVQIYQFNTTSISFAAGAAFLLDTIGVASVKTTFSIDLVAGETAYIVYTGEYATGAWVKCSSFAEFDAL